MNKKSPSTVRGMHDLYGEDHKKQQNIINSFVNVVSLFNFSPISTPILEHEVFLRTLVILWCCHERSILFGQK